jgi:hypothetical protein
MALLQCPVCASNRVVLVVSPRPRAFCAQCGARWFQNGSEQRNIIPERVDPDHPSLKGRRKES